MRFTALASLAGFATYFCMYAFRKPFAAASYLTVAGWHFELDFKIAIVIAQVLGYASAKFIGIKVIGEMRPGKRAKAIVGLIGAAWVALLAFALLPADLKVAAMYLNGLSLGMIWGLVFSFMEGRRTAEVLGAVLCASFILSSGVVKSVGLVLMHRLGVPEFWMPAATGAVFAPILLLSVWGLSALPPPSSEDQAARAKRAPMSGSERSAFLADYAIGIVLLVATYVFATALRDFRDNFGAELWSRLGFADPAGVFTSAEVPVAAVALVAMGIVVRVKNNARALTVIHGLILCGLVLCGAATLAFDAGVIGPVSWMILSGAGLYVVYTPFNAMLFDRLVAVRGRVANAGFLIYIADAAGYAGSCALLLWRNFTWVNADWLTVFRYALYTTASVGIVLMSGSLLYFRLRGRGTPLAAAPAAAGD